MTRIAFISAMCNWFLPSNDSSTPASCFLNSAWLQCLLLKMFWEPKIEDRGKAAWFGIWCAPQIWLWLFFSSFTRCDLLWIFLLENLLLHSKLSAFLLYGHNPSWYIIFLFSRAWISSSFYIQLLQNFPISVHCSHQLPSLPKILCNFFYHSNSKLFILLFRRNLLDDCYASCPRKINISDPTLEELTV